MPSYFIDLMGCIVAVIGMAMWCDGLSSWWVYHNKKGESFWRNHSLRLMRMLYGVALIAIGVLLVIYG